MFENHRILHLSLTLICGAHLGCGDSASPSDSGVTPNDAGAVDGARDAGSGLVIAREDYCEALVRAQCEAHQACCDPASAYESVDECFDGRLDRCIPVFTGQAWTAGTARFRGDVAAQWIEELTVAAASDCVYQPGDWIRDVVEGLAAEGADCRTTTSVGRDSSLFYGCEEGLACFTLRDATDMAQCRPVVEDGGSCEVAPCGPTSNCTMDRQCVPRGEAGEACTSTRLQCANGLICVAGECSEPSYCLRIRN